MERDKLHGLIREKNERLERETLRTAEQLIDAIANQQETIRKAQARIEELRVELKALTVQQMDAAALLGEG